MRMPVTPEALGVLEVGSIHEGIAIVDVMAKEAPIEILAASPIPPGRFLIVIGGGVGEVESAWKRGIALAPEAHDRLFLAEVASQVLVALRPLSGPGVQAAGRSAALPVDALGLFETTSVSACLDAADQCVKGAAVDLPRIHVARGISGKSFAVLSGRQDMVEAALAIAEERARPHGRWLGSTLLARPDPAVAQRLMVEPWGFFGGQEIL